MSLLKYFKSAKSGDISACQLFHMKLFLGDSGIGNRPC